MIKKNIPGVCMIEFDLGELYSYLELFNKVYGGYEKEVDILLAAVLDVFKTEYSPGGTEEALITLTEEQGERLVKSLGQRMLDKQKARTEMNPYER